MRVKREGVTSFVISGHGMESRFEAWPPSLSVAEMRFVFDVLELLAARPAELDIS